MKHHVKVVAVRVPFRHDLLDCDARRIVGYRLVCSCGWRAPVRRTVAQVRDDRVAARVHVQ